MKKVMKKSARTGNRHVRNGTPTWDIARLFPNQGTWEEEEYLGLETNQLIEFSDGFLEFLPMPTMSHQWTLQLLFEALKAFVWPKLGLALFAGIRIKLRSGKFRQPDIVFMLKEHQHRIHEEFWDGADLAMEVVSGSREDRRRDLVLKREEYARAGIAEYWIVDPKQKQITVLRLEGKKYVVHGEFKEDQIARSWLLAGFKVAVKDVFAGPRM